MGFIGNHQVMTCETAEDCDQLEAIDSSVFIDKNFSILIEAGNQHKYRKIIANYWGKQYDEISAHYSVITSGWHLCIVGYAQRDNINIVMCAIEGEAGALVYATPRLQQNAELIIIALLNGINCDLIYAGVLVRGYSREDNVVWLRLTK